jgi:hypothetical protein
MNHPGLRAHLLLGMVVTMPSRYGENTKTRAVWLIWEHRDDFDKQWAVMRPISPRNPG